MDQRPPLRRPARLAAVVAALGCVVVSFVVVYGRRLPGRVGGSVR